jgi:chromosome segregation ATPase
MNSRTNSLWLCLALAPVPALVAHAQDNAAAAVQQAANAVGKARAELPRLAEGAAKAEEKAKAAQEEWQKHQPKVVAAQRKVEFARERAKQSGSEEDKKRLTEAEKNLRKIEAAHHRLSLKMIDLRKEADAFARRIKDLTQAAEAAIAAAQIAIDGMQNKPVEKQRLQDQLNKIKAEWAKK